MIRTTPARVLGALVFVAVTGCGQPRGESQEPTSTTAAESEPASPARPADEPAPSAVRTNAETRVWDFDGAAPGELPQGFTAAVGRWEATRDESAPSGGQTLAQLASSADDAFNVTLVGGTSEGDVDLSVQLRSVSGRVDQGGGLVWRARDAQSYYIARYNPLEDNFRVYVVEEGRRRMLESATVQVDHAAWHTLRVVMHGDRIECYLDGTRHLEANDETFAEAGQLGLWTKADAVTHFDDLTLAASEPPPG